MSDCLILVNVPRETFTFIKKCQELLACRNSGRVQDRSQIQTFGVSKDSGQARMTVRGIYGKLVRLINNDDTTTGVTVFCVIPAPEQESRPINEPDPGRCQDLDSRFPFTPHRLRGRE